MTHRARRLIAAAAAGGALIALPAVASAIGPATTVTAPAAGRFIVGSNVVAGMFPSVTVAGTSAVISGHVDILCMAGTVRDTIVTNVPTDAAGAFSVSVSAATFGNTAGGYCTLTAVASGSSPDVNNTGPRVFVADERVDTWPGDTPYNIYVLAKTGASTAFDVESLGNFGLDDSYTYDASGLPRSVFYGNDGVTAGLQSGASGVPDPTAGITVDGRNAVLPASAEGFLPFSSNPPTLHWAVTLDPSGRHSVVSEGDQVNVCSTNTLPVASLTDCGTTSPSGVFDSRTQTIGSIPGAGWSSGSGQDVIRDSWSSTDGKSHTVRLRTLEYFPSTTYGFSASWVGAMTTPLTTVIGFLGHTPPPGYSVIPPTALPITYRTVVDPTTSPSAGNPIGVAAIYPAPSSIEWANNVKWAYFMETIHVPARGTVSRARVYAVGISYAELRRLERFAKDEVVIPRLSVSRSTGVFTRASTETIRGRLADPGGSDAVTVNRHRVRVRSNGRFSYSIGLHKGHNTFTVRAVDSAGNTAQVVIHIVRR